MSQSAQATMPRSDATGTAMNILFSLAVAHMLNDTFQAMLPAIYPLLKDSYHLTFTQIGLITLTYQLTGSLLQPVVGFYTDRKPKPYSLPIGMGVSLLGMCLLSQAHTFPLMCLAAGMMGLGSSVFHPEASRVARMASGGRHGFAQSLFQVGGNFGTSLGPLLAAAIIIPRGQAHILWFTALAVVGIMLLARIGRWYRENMHRLKPKPAAHGDFVPIKLSRGKVAWAIAVLIVLVFSKYFYLISLTNYYTFYTMDKFGVSVQASQIYLFAFLFAVAAGTIIGGPVGDRIGRKKVIWISILGVAPFSLLLPHAGLVGTVVLTIIIGLILASAFSAILVYAQELVPGNVGLIAGLFFGLAFGAAGIGSAMLGRLADHTSIRTVFSVSAFFPLLGLMTAFLPEVERKVAHRAT
jgi:FSR family fosmidomycin resistance protein-like MFS transporter